MSIVSRPVAASFSLGRRLDQATAQPMPAPKSAPCPTLDRRARHLGQGGSSVGAARWACAGRPVRAPRLAPSRPWDVRADAVAAINAGRSHVSGEPGLAEGVADAHAPGCSTPRPMPRPPSGRGRGGGLIVPVMLDEVQQPDYRYHGLGVDSIGGGVHAGLTVIFETTLPVGGHARPLRAAAGGGLWLAGRERLLRRVLPERLYSGADLRELGASSLDIASLSASKTAS